jgi:type IV pilus assembly protein PilY1
MKHRHQSLVAALAGIALSLSMGSVALADDTEIFVNQSTTVGVKPNILFVIDTSGSMSGAVASDRPPYDPARVYTGACDPAYVYWRANSSGVSGNPTCGTTRRVQIAENRCGAADFALTGIGGRWTGKFRRYDEPTARWADLVADDDASMIECSADSGVHGADAVATALYAQNGDVAEPWVSDEDREIEWGATTAYTVYSANWLNWINGPPEPTVLSRLQVVQAVATSLVGSIDDVNLGLMRFSNNAGNAQGGMVIHAVEDITTSRASITSEIAALTASGATPLSETMYEAQQYWAGRAVDYGLTSSTDGGGTITPSVPASRDPTDSSLYGSPIEYQCQRNFTILLTDGEPVQDVSANGSITSLPQYASVVGAGCSGAGDGACLADIAEYMNKADLSTSLAGVQTSSTYTIGFGPAVAGSALLAETATRGGGKAYSANDVADLTTTLQEIVSNIVQTSSTFTTPSVSINAFNRAQSLNELYISVFSPEETARWPGNLKKYALKDGQIVDANDNLAVDATTGFFRQGAQSIWSAAPDSDSVELGGAVSRLPAEPQRNMYTYIEAVGQRALTNSVNRFETSNAALTDALLGVDVANPTRDQLIDWARGIDVLDVDADGDTTESNRFMGDPLHARPALVIYGGTTATPDVTDAVVFITTNDGYLHAVDADTGVELWSFIPPELLGRLPQLYRNAGVAARTYGLDGDVRVIKFDVNLDGIVDAAAGDRVFIYFGMRRGGQTYYAVDVTDRDAPRLMWTAGPAELPGVGETWSAPAVARVRVNGAVQNGENLVLIFAGGYDGAQENYAYVEDTMGHRIYMVDAVSGNLLWYAGGPGGAGSPDLEIDSMTNSIPGRVSVLDIDGDQFADRLYAADMGGRVLRFDIYNGNSRGTLVTGGVFARLGAGDNAAAPLADNRRFYYAPDVALIQRRGADPYYNLAIGSGYRGHPLETDTRDRFYSLRDKTPFAKLTQAAYDAFTPITEADLVDITDNPGVTPVPTNARGWQLELRLNGGWVGEKILAEAITVGGVILFPSYQPTPAALADPCVPSTGLNRVYAVTVDSGRPAVDFNNDQALTVDDLSTELAQAGIAGEVGFAYESVGSLGGGGGTNGNGNGVDQLGRRAVCLVGVEVLNRCVQPDGVVRTFWRRDGAD